MSEYIVCQGEDHSKQGNWNYVWVMILIPPSGFSFWQVCTMTSSVLEVSSDSAGVDQAPFFLDAWWVDHPNPFLWAWPKDGQPRCINRNSWLRRLRVSELVDQVRRPHPIGGFPQLCSIHTLSWSKPQESEKQRHKTPAAYGFDRRFRPFWGLIFMSQKLNWSR